MVQIQNSKKSFHQKSQDKNLDSVVTPLLFRGGAGGEAINSEKAKVKS